MAQVVIVVDLLHSPGMLLMSIVMVSSGSSCFGCIELRSRWLWG